MNHKTIEQVYFEFKIIQEDARQYRNKCHNEYKDSFGKCLDIWQPAAERYSDACSELTHASEDCYSIFSLWISLQTIHKNP